MRKDSSTVAIRAVAILAACSLWLALAGCSSGDKTGVVPTLDSNLSSASSLLSGTDSAVVSIAGSDVSADSSGTVSPTDSLGSSSANVNSGSGTSSSSSGTSSIASVSPASSVSSQPAASSSASAVSSGASSAASSSASSAPVAVNVTIPEGYSFMQIANLLEQDGICSASAFYAAAQAYQPKSFSIPTSSDRCFHLEGYLFPDTYTFYKNIDPSEVIVRMLNDYVAKSGMPSDSTLILASIIEREARSTENFALVSSVFHNRLNAGMQLDADCTRDYVNNFITGNSLLGDTSRFAALYNTYKCAALPAGPICCPGARAIQAAENPAQSNYLYFFFGTDGQNHYSATLDEQNQQIAQIGVASNG